MLADKQVSPNPESSAPAPQPEASAPPIESAPSQPADSSPASAPPAAASGNPVTLDELTSTFVGGLLDELPQKVRARFKLGHFTAIDGDAATFALPNEHVVPRCEEVRTEVESALQTRFGRPLTIQLVVDGSSPAPSAPVATAAPTPPPAPDAQVADEIGDVSQLENANDVASNSLDRLTEAFPGATVIDAPDS